MKQNYRNGQIIEGVITGVQPYGAFVTIDAHTTGLIHISEISDEFVRDINYYVTQGERVIAKVIDTDSHTKQLRLSLKALNYSSRKERMSKDYRRASVPKPVLGFSTLEKMMPKWIEEKQCQK